ncbi:hypothetical protein PR048_002596 [Dryococelus australis]|uniref:Telomerase reverse transcriptase n=1 Tax=Dryococelus australis TaxID=614101 RepID=A0ABQ9IM45_9NEOP|nr:hypothetical protein PR048_002596 [Dryococelus australis]
MAYLGNNQRRHIWGDFSKTIVSDCSHSRCATLKVSRSPRGGPFAVEVRSRPSGNVVSLQRFGRGGGGRPLVKFRTRATFDPSAKVSEEGSGVSLEACDSPATSSLTGSLLFRSGLCEAGVCVASFSSARSCTVKCRECDSAQGRGKREIPDKTHRPAASSGTLLPRENAGATMEVIDDGVATAYLLHVYQGLHVGSVADTAVACRSSRGAPVSSPRLQFRRVSPSRLTSSSRWADRRNMRRVLESLPPVKRSSAADAAERLRKMCQVEPLRACVYNIVTRSLLRIPRERGKVKDSSYMIAVAANQRPADSSVAATDTWRPRVPSSRLRKSDSLSGPSRKCPASKGPGHKQVGGCLIRRRDNAFQRELQDLQDRNMRAMNHTRTARGTKCAGTEFFLLKQAYVCQPYLAPNCLPRLLGTPRLQEVLASRQPLHKSISLVVEWVHCCDWGSYLLRTIRHAPTERMLQTVVRQLLSCKGNLLCRLAYLLIFRLLHQAFYQIRHQKKSAVACSKDPSQHSPGVISGNHVKPKSEWLDRESNPVASRMRVQTPQCYRVLRASSRTVDLTRRVSRPLVDSYHKHLVRTSLRPCTQLDGLRQRLLATGPLRCAECPNPQNILALRVCSSAPQQEEEEEDEGS